MSRAARLGLLATLALLAGTSSASAQQTEAELVQRLDSLRPLMEASDAELEAYEARRDERAAALAAAAASVDTLRVGLMTVLTPSGQAEVARDLVREAWDERYADVSSSPGVEGTTFVVRWSDDPAPIHARGAVQRVENARSIPRARMLEQIRFSIGQTLRNDLVGQAREVGRWVPDDPHRDHDRASIYRQLATTRSVSTHRCLEGDVDACAASLGLGVEEDALEIWYTPEERRALVASVPNIGRTRLAVPQWNACVQAGDFAACDALLRDVRGGAWPPLPGSTRASLVGFALRRGGAGAWGRLIGSPDTPPERALELASGLPLETLVSEWRSWIIDGRPETYGGLPQRGGLALLWTLAFAAFATRSTRWRLG